MGPRAGLDDVEKRKFLTVEGLEFRPLGHSARSPSLYRLRYRCGEKKNLALPGIESGPSNP
jgi:hypothetical protein